jgi:hypothetical protein
MLWRRRSVVTIVVVVALVVAIALILVVAVVVALALIIVVVLALVLGNRGRLVLVVILVRRVDVAVGRSSSLRLRSVAIQRLSLGRVAVVTVALHDGLRPEATQNVSGLVVFWLATQSKREAAGWPRFALQLPAATGLGSNSLRGIDLFIRKKKTTYWRANNADR